MVSDENADARREQLGESPTSQTAQYCRARTWSADQLQLKQRLPGLRAQDLQAGMQGALPEAPFHVGLQRTVKAASLTQESSRNVRCKRRSAGR